jgi:hypothetical protein
LSNVILCGRLASPTSAAQSAQSQQPGDEQPGSGGQRYLRRDVYRSGPVILEAGGEITDAAELGAGKNGAGDLRNTFSAATRCSPGRATASRGLENC